MLFYVIKTYSARVDDTPQAKGNQDPMLADLIDKLRPGQRVRVTIEGYVDGDIPHEGLLDRAVGRLFRGSIEPVSLNRDLKNADHDGHLVLRLMGGAIKPGITGVEVID